MDNEIYILSGKLHSGKTTLLENWVDGKNISGFLSPVINEKRHFLNLKSHEFRQLEVEFSNLKLENIILKEKFLHGRLKN